MGLRELLDREVQAAFGRLSNSFENPTFIPSPTSSGADAVDVERRKKAEDDDKMQQEY